MMYASHIISFKKDLNDFFDDILIELDTKDGKLVTFSKEATESIFKTLEYKINEYKNIVGLQLWVITYLILKQENMKQECIAILRLGISIMDILENLCGGIFIKKIKK